MRILDSLQRVDRRVIYLLLIFVIALPFIVPLPPLPVNVSPQSQAFYDTIEGIANDPVQKNKLIILSTNYAAGTKAENQTQTVAVVTHLMQRGLKFAIFAFNDPQGRENGQQVVDSLAPKFNYKYGENYVNWGYRPPGAIQTILKSAVNDIPGTIGNDYDGKPVASFPVMQNIKTVDDIGAIIEVSPADTITPWIQFFQGAGKGGIIPTLYCPTSVMAQEALPYLKSGQLKGMLTGLTGATEYEKLVNAPAFGIKAAMALSFSHVLIIGLLIMGNVAMLLARRGGATPTRPVTEDTAGGER